MAGPEKELPDFSEPDEPGQKTMAAEDLRLGPRPGLKPWLLVVGGVRSLGTLIEIKGKVTIGRSPPSTVILDEEGVSRQHAQIEIMSNVVRVSDLGASNGLRVNGRQVKVHPLRDGERLRLGDAVLTLLHFDDNTALMLKNMQASLDARKKK